MNDKPSKPRTRAEWLEKARQVIPPDDLDLVGKMPADIAREYAGRGIPIFDLAVIGYLAMLKGIWNDEAQRLHRDPVDWLRYSVRHSIENEVERTGSRSIKHDWQQKSEDRQQ